MSDGGPSESAAWREAAAKIDRAPVRVVCPLCAARDLEIGDGWWRGGEGGWTTRCPGCGMSSEYRGPMPEAPRVPELNTERLRLRSFAAAPAHADGLWRMFRDPIVTEFTMEGRTMADRDHADAWLARMMMRHHEIWGAGYGAWAVERRRDGAVIGMGLVKRLALSRPDGDADRDVEIGWTLERAAWGAGYATEFSRALLAYALDDLGLPEVFAIVDPANVGSRAVAQRIGMDFVGLTSRYHDMELALYRASARKPA